MKYDISSLHNYASQCYSTYDKKYSICYYQQGYWEINPYGSVNINSKITRQTSLQLCVDYLNEYNDQKYIRLLNYDNACIVIDFINKNDYGYAYITPGAVALQVPIENWDTVENFIKSLDVRYEIGIEEGYKVNEKIITHLKKHGAI